MKSSFLTVALSGALLARSLVLASDAPPPAASAASSPADAEWAVVTRSFDPMAANGGAPRPGPANPSEDLRWGLRFYRGLVQAGLAFCAHQPTDARRWVAVQQMVDKADWIERCSTPGQIALAHEVASASEWSAWQTRIEELRLAGITAADTPPKQRVFFDSVTFFRLRGAAHKACNENRPVNLTPLRAELDRLAAMYPDADEVSIFCRFYMQLEERVEKSPAAINQLWAGLATSPNRAVREVAAKRSVMVSQLQKPLNLAFTAVDGRAVDMKDLRGKVVLVDFWATWCGPCKAELPNIKQVYAAYHDKGFEVIGIALENGNLKPGDPAALTEAKLEKAKKVLTDFTAANNMPWPQYFDGKAWKNDVSTRFAIESIPAMFLVDTSGVVVSTDARGPKLEREVKRLLGM